MTPEPTDDPVEIDGARGEGGGQILRTALALSMITRRPFVMRRIRAGRAKPGLQRQHLACVSAAARLCGTTVRDVGVGASTLTFFPGAHWADELEIDIGTAGSTTLVVQTVLVPALVAGKPFRAVISGGTHNQMAPPFEFLDRVFLPCLRRMGAQVSLGLDRHGFVPRGGGRIVLDVQPGALRPIELLEAGPIVARRVTAIVAGLARSIAERELATARTLLDQPACELREVVDTGPANAVIVELELASGARDLAIAHGRRGYPAEAVATEAVEAALAFANADVPVGEHLADQLLLPLAVAGGGGFRCASLSLHATTNIETIGQFLDTPIRVTAAAGATLVTVG